MCYLLLVVVLLFPEFEATTWSHRSTHLSTFHWHNSSVVTNFQLSTPEELKSKALKTLLKATPLTLATAESCSTHPGFLSLVPELKATLNKTTTVAQFSTACFQNVSVILSFILPYSLKLDLYALDPISFFCADAYAFIAFDEVFMDFIFARGKHQYVFNPLTPKNLGSFGEFGLKIFLFCESVSELMESGFVLAHLFSDLMTNGNLGRRPQPAVVETAVLHFLNITMGYDLKQRRQAASPVSTADIHSGDMFATMSLEGPGTIIMYSTGSHISHTAMALWMLVNSTRVLHVVESHATGIRKTPYHQWLKIIQDSNEAAVLLPLKPIYRQIFNEETALAAFQTVLGTPYGYDNFLFGWIDTEEQNYPRPFTKETFLMSFYILEQSKPADVQKLLGGGLNKRLGTDNLNLSDLANVARSRNQTLYQVLAEPEQDTWLYGGNRSLVCSAFLMFMYKHAGVITGIEFQATEFVPKDVYALDIFDKNSTVLAKCKGNDPDLEYCQLTGKYRIELGAEYASVRPYSHMNQKCSGVSPTYERTPYC